MNLTILFGICIGATGRIFPVELDGVLNKAMILSLVMILFVFAVSFGVENAFSKSSLTLVIAELFVFAVVVVAVKSPCKELSIVFADNEGTFVGLVVESSRITTTICISNEDFRIDT